MLSTWPKRTHNVMNGVQIRSHQIPSSVGNHMLEAPAASSRVFEPAAVFLSDVLS